MAMTMTMTMTMTMSVRNRDLRRNGDHARHCDCDNRKREKLHRGRVTFE